MMTPADKVHCWWLCMMTPVDKVVEGTLLVVVGWHKVGQGVCTVLLPVEEGVCGRVQTTASCSTASTRARRTVQPAVEGCSATW